MTEQEIILNIVLPFLKEIGFGPEDIKAEKSFSLRLGHYVYRVDTEEQIRRAAPRLDLLITRNGVNLFVFEVKRDDLPLKDEDRDQAVSYAKMLHPVAPFVILTNGRDTRIYETISKNRIEPADFKVKDNYTLDLPLTQKYDYLQRFVGYSASNLQVFSHAQVAAAIKPLAGSLADKSPKYAPELFEPRRSLETALATFLQSNVAGFLILGDSGSGKTSALCHLAFSMTESNWPLFFYKSFDLQGTLLAEIASDFNWQFSAQISEVEVIRRLLELPLDRPIVFVLDAIDEWMFEGRARSLVNFLRRISGHHIKLIMSCKTRLLASVCRLSWNSYRHRGLALSMFGSSILSTRSDGP